MTNNSNPFIPNHFENLTPNIFSKPYLKLIKDIALFCHPLERKKSVRMFLRSLFWQSQTFGWFRHIASDTILSKLVLIETNLPEKLHREILRTDYSIDKRLAILVEHYQLIVKLISPTLLEKALIGGGLELAEIDVTEQGGQIYRLELVYGAYPAKEGELSLVMLDEERTALVRLSFSVLQLTADDHAIYIAGLQGIVGEHSREKVATASKACFGLHPRRIAMEAIFALAKHTKAQQILGVPDKHHVSSKKNHKHFDYDNYWLDFDASLDVNGNYVLPLVPKHKDYADTPRKRRAKYRRQHELLDTVPSPH